MNERIGILKFELNKKKEVTDHALITVVKDIEIKHFCNILNRIWCEFRSILGIVGLFYFSDSGVFVKK